MAATDDRREDCIAARMLYRDRSDAGRTLARSLMQHGASADIVVVALPRGGVPIGVEVADALHVRLDVLVARKLGFPNHEERAMGAIAPHDVVVLDEAAIARANVPSEVVAAVPSKEQKELVRRETTYRAGRPELDVAGRIAIVVDDGLATGATMLAAVRSLRQRGASRVVVAVPVGTSESCRRVAAEADEVVCAANPEPFHGVGHWYGDFSQVTDDEVIELLARARG